MKKRLFIVLLFLSVLSGNAWAHEHDGHEAAVSAEEPALGVPLGFLSPAEMINLHPIFAHFPVVLLFMASFFYGAGRLMRKEVFFEVGKWMLYSGVLFAAVSVWTGLEAAETAAHDRPMHEVMLLHRNLGYVILGLSALLAAWIFRVKTPVPARRQLLFLSAMAILAVLILQQADLGGRMVFLNGVGVGKKSMLPPGSSGATFGEALPSKNF